MEKKVFKSIEEEEQDFNNILNQAAQIKSYQMSLERKQFDKLPDFYKEGLYNYSSLKNVYRQSFPIKKYTYESIKHQGVLYLNLKQYENALEQFIKCLCIFKYIILKLESNNIKALYRKAKSYIDIPKIKPNNIEIKNTLEQFSKKLNDDMKKENKIYKNY